MTDSRTKVAVNNQPDRRLREHVEAVSGVGSWWWSAEAGAVQVSTQLRGIFGVDVDAEATDAGLIDLVHPADRLNLQMALTSAVRGAGVFDVDIRIVRPDGQLRELQVAGHSERDSCGVVTDVIGSVQDVTTPRAQAAQFSDARELIAGMLEAASEQAIIGFDTTGLITVFNPGAEHMFGFLANDVIGVLSVMTFYDPAEVASLAAKLGVSAGLPVLLGTALLGGPYSGQWTFLTQRGERLHGQATVTSTLGPDGGIAGYITVITDITAQYNAQRALHASQALFEDMFRHAPSGMLMAKLSGPTPGRLVRVNPALSRLTGYSTDQLLEMSVEQLTHPDDRGAHRARFASLALGHGVVAEAERRWVDADGHDLWVQFNLSPVGSVGTHIVGMVEDITARKVTDNRSQHWAMHDQLTGLPNRSLLLDRVEHALLASTRSGREMAVLHVNLDNFAAVNESFGRLVGDQFLVIAARRLQREIRAGDTVARIGGDDFVVLCPDVSDADQSPADASNAQALADRLLASLTGPYQHGSITHHVGASIGVTISSPGVNPSTLLRVAADAMYLAKSNGQNVTSAAEKGKKGATAVLGTVEANRRQRIQQELVEGLDRDELIMHGQPVINLRTGAVVAVEMLLRWHHPTRGLLAPAHFLDIAETSPLMPRIGQRVLRESCRIAANWTMPDGGDPPSVFVNLFGRQMEAHTLLSDVNAALQTSGLPPSRLVLELTETSMPLIGGSLLTDLEELRRKGIRLAIDDVGTGYSSLSRLTELPIDILKIDRTFTAGVGAQAACDAVIQAILSIGRNLGLQVVAEGVETPQQARSLTDYDCQYAQGFLYSKPRPEAELSSLFSEPVRWDTAVDAHRRSNSR